MSITYTSQRNNLSKSYPPENSNSFPDPEILPYTRPSDWLTLPSMTTSTQAFYGLYAITNSSTNFVAISANVSAGNVLIDWGDGTTNTVASGVQVNHEYTYSAISSGTLTTRGYKQVIISVTPVTGNLTLVNTQLKYVGPAAPNTGYTASSNWLDIKMGSPFMNGLSISNNGPTVWMPLLEKFELVSGPAAGLSAFNAFRNLIKLQEFIWPANVPITSSSFMFGSCQSLVNAPNLPLGVANQNCSFMFNLCIALRNVPNYDFSGATNTSFSSMFNGCTALRKAPAFTNTTGVTDWSSMFNGCNQLLYAPSYDARNATTLAAMFQNCRTLVTAPYINTTNVANFNAVFNGCSSLQNVPAYEMTNATNVSGMFQGCGTIQKLPSFNLPKLTLLDNIFTGCTNLREIGAIVTTGNLVTMNGTFTSCLSLEVPPFITNTSNVTAMFNVFNTCRSLKSIPDYNMSNVANVANLFINCSSLTTAPDLNLTKVTTAAGMFDGCTALTTVPSYNTSNVANTVLMFNGCTSLDTAPTLDLTKCTNAAQMFGGCSSLQDTSGIQNTGNVLNAASMYSSCLNLIEVPNHNLDKNLNFNSMFSSCYALNSIPAYNMANATNTTGFVSTCPQIANVLVTGSKVSISVSTCKLGKTELETFMTNLGSNTAVQTLTITTNPGADTAISRASCSIVNNTQDVVNTGIQAAGVVEGMYATGTNITTALTVTVTAGTDLISHASLTLNPPIGTRVSFTTTANGITQYAIYYVVTQDGSGAFKISATPGGSVLDITGTGSMTMNYENIVQSVSTNGVYLSWPAQATGTTTIAFRKLNTNIARLKNWNITG